MRYVPASFRLTIAVGRGIVRPRFIGVKTTVADDAFRSAVTPDEKNGNAKFGKLIHSVMPAKPRFSRNRPLPLLMPFGDDSLNHAGKLNVSDGVLRRTTKRDGVNPIKDAFVFIAFQFRADY